MKKVSEVIELALNKAYGPAPTRSSFMCHAVQDLWLVGLINLEEYAQARDAIHYLVKNICPMSSKGNSLEFALTMKEPPIISTFLQRKELYIWWVFDLKRKGL